MAPRRTFQPGPTAIELTLADPYQALIAAIFERALADATGTCSIRTDRPTDRLQHAARSWLLGQEAEDLLTLAGYEASVILRRVRQVLGPP